MSACLEVGVAHAAALATLHAAVFTHAPWNEAAFSSLLGQPGVTALLHAQNGFLLLRAVLDEAEILTFGTTQKRMGIGSQLLHAGITLLTQTGVRTLFLEVASRNHEARAFYTAFGFVETGRRHRYYEDGDDAILMCLPCPSPGDA